MLGGDNRANGGRCRCYHYGKIIIITPFTHGRDQHGAQTRGIGGSRTGNTSEQHTGKNISLGQSATNMTDSPVRKRNNSLTDATAVHQRSCQHEQRNCHHRKGIKGNKKSLRNNFHRQIHRKQNGNQCRAAERISNGDIENQQCKKTDEQNCRYWHGRILPPSFFSHSCRHDTPVSFSRCQPPGKTVQPARLPVFPHMQCRWGSSWLGT